ncbi:protein of unassigned function [Methylobacterium oryzae CBMB20]|uniref:Protein of unassigned function n=1 Tax=Methylobacterium oryzae CBMB20 TaxID=693986 RepID=A0A089QAD0_9HYPH|nr:protein of unassigned function [Methylobacterium oryzae CBMB20]
MGPPSHFQRDEGASRNRGPADGIVRPPDLAGCPVFETGSRSPPWAKGGR